MRCGFLEQPGPLQDDRQRDGDDGRHDPEHGVAVLPLELRHDLEVHAVDAAKKRER